MKYKPLHVFSILVLRAGLLYFMDQFMIILYDITRSSLLNSGSSS